MTKDELIMRLHFINYKLRNETNYDEENAHYEADSLLLSYINDIDIEEVFNEIPKWYA